MPTIIVQFENAFAKVFSDIFRSTAELYRQMVVYIVLPLLKVKTIQEAAKRFQFGKDQLYRLLQSQSAECWLRLLRSLAYERFFTLLAAMQGKYPSFKTRSRLTICCDDSGFAKSGQKMPLVGLIWHGALQRVCAGTSALFFSVVVGDNQMAFPLDLRLCRGKGGAGRQGRPTRSKIASVVQMLVTLGKEAKRRKIAFERVVFVADSWFASQEILSTGRKYGIPMIVAGKGNHVFNFGGCHLKVGHWIRFGNIPWRTTDDGRYVYARYQVTHKTFGSVLLIFVRNDQGTVQSLICTATHFTGPKIIADYKLRWSIEVFFKDAKQLLGFKEFRFQSSNAIYGHFVLRSILYHILDWFRWFQFRRQKTVGDVFTWFSAQLNDNQLISLRIQEPNLICSLFQIHKT